VKKRTGEREKQTDSEGATSGLQIIFRGNLGGNWERDSVGNDAEEPGFEKALASGKGISLCDPSSVRAVA
jgi:hypothetical protein